MSTETLTAEERESLVTCYDPDESVIKLVRLYDAALARAEAGWDARERLNQDWKRRHTSWLEQAQREIDARKAAESRLAEATALLRSPDRGTRAWNNQRLYFLSPAPAAESEPDTGERSEEWRAGYLEGLDDAVKEIEAGERLDTKLSDAVGKIETMLALQTRIAQAVAECRVYDGTPEIDAIAAILRGERT